MKNWVELHVSPSGRPDDARPDWVNLQQVIRMRYDEEKGLMRLFLTNGNIILAHRPADIETLLGYVQDNGITPQPRLTLSEAAG